MNPNTLLGSALIVLAVAGILLAYALAVRDMLRGPVKGLLPISDKDLKVLELLVRGIEAIAKMPKALAFFTLSLVLLAAGLAVLVWRPIPYA